MTETKLHLVNNGIFPCFYDENGNKISDESQLGMDIGPTIQGEGSLMGVPSLFIRTSGCTLRCMFSSSTGEVNLCDTPYSSFSPENNTMTVLKAAKIIKNNMGYANNLVITGGEPMLQSAALTELLEELKPLNLIVTIEASGTVYRKDILPHIDLFSISPKLSTSTPTKEKLEKVKKINFTLNAFSNVDRLKYQHETYRRNLLPLQQFINYTKGNNKGLQLKFVVTSESDVEEIIKTYLEGMDNINRSDIYLMPEGITQGDLDSKTKWVIKECIKNGFNYCPRLHIELFGDKRDV